MNRFICISTLLLVMMVKESLCMNEPIPTFMFINHASLNPASNVSYPLDLLAASLRRACLNELEPSQQLPPWEVHGKSGTHSFSKKQTRSRQFFSY